MVVMALPAAHVAAEEISAPDPAPVPLREENNSATRHLSAGAYLDPDFCLTALHQIYYQARRMVAPSYGFDAIAVLGHCLRARGAMVVRDALLVGLLLVLPWLSMAAALLTLSALLFLRVTVVGSGVLREAFHYLTDGRHFRNSLYPEAVSRSRAAGEKQAGGRAPDRRRRRFALLWLENVVAQVGMRVLGIVSAYLLLMVATVLLAVRVWHAPGLGCRFGIPLRYAAGGATAVAFLIPALTRIWSRLQLRKLVPGRIPHRPVETRRLIEIEQQNLGNTVVYSQDPFVGSGVHLRSWNITHRLVRPPVKIAGLDTGESELDREFEEPPFIAAEINEYVRRYLADLAGNPVPEWRLSNLSVEDRVFVAGTKMRLAHLQTPAWLLAEIIRHPIAPARHYLTCQVVSWGGELVTTVYVHFAMQGKALYVELNVVGLLPCDERYRIVDQVGGTGPRRLFRDAGRAVVEAPALLAAAPVSLARAVADVARMGFSRRFPNRRRIRTGFDYGAIAGLREIGICVQDPDPMQKQDITKYSRVVERRVLAAVLDFLQMRGVDVAEYRQSTLTVLSAGVVNAGGGSVRVDTATGTEVNNQSAPGGE
jgi:hypothetical protein